MAIPHRLIWKLILLLGSLAAVTAISYVNLPVAKAETKQIDLTLNADSDRTFESFMEEVESLAKKSIEQGFAASPSVTEVSVSIVGKNDEFQVPLLLARVSRVQWQREPKIKRWSRSLSSSAILLGFYNSQSSPATLPNSSGTVSPPRRRLEDDPAFRDD